MILMSELPRIPFDMPDTWMVKESCPSKSDLAVYENPEPSNFTWPDCGGEMSFAVSMVTRLWRRPRMQLWPLSVRMVQSTASDFSSEERRVVRTHASPSAGRTNSVGLVCGLAFGPTETMILMSELPRIPFDMPDTWMVKESCPSKSDLAVYENPEPSNFTWPDCGGEMSFAVSMVTRLWRRPRMQLWPLSVRTVQSTASDFS